MGPQKPKIMLQHTLRIYWSVIIVIFVVLFLRLAWLQLIQTEIYQTKAVSNTMRWIAIEASRGEIVDTKGQVLVTNRPVFNISLNYLGLKDQDIDKVIHNLVEIFNDPEITFENIKTLLKGQNRLYEPIMVKRDVSMEVVTAIEERRRDLPGVSVEVHPQRAYPYGSLAGHLLGYVHSIKEELEQPGFEDYSINDLVGKTGLEKGYEKYLNGQKGYRQVEVTSLNQPVREVRKISPVSGHKLVLTLDLKLQQTLENSFDEVLAQVQKKYPKAKAGGAVVLDVKTGKVLAMVSRPGLNPDDFNGRSLNQAQVDYYFRNSPPALRNRVVQGSYVPGSVFKPITGMAALADGHLSPSEKVLCTGQYWHPPKIKCWNVHGQTDYYKAIARSCNVYFQEMARRAGIEKIGQVGQEFGLGARTGIDLPFESSGLLPHVEWQKKEFAARQEKINQAIDKKIATLEKEYNSKIEAVTTEKEKKQLEKELASKKRNLEYERQSEISFRTTWHDYDTYNTAIGQGYNQFTIIQLANYVATLANNGLRHKPYVVEKIIDDEGNVVQEFFPEVVMTTSVPLEVLEETKKAMTMTTAPGGTAYSLFWKFPEEIKVAAKTGTAQPGRAGYVKNKDFDGLFIAFAPADDPEIAFAGVIEHGYSGSGSAGLVAKAVFEEYFGLTKPKPQPQQQQVTPPPVSVPQTPVVEENQQQTEEEIESEGEETEQTPPETPTELPEVILPEQTELE
ncbi:MAG: penicillin-binding protein 2 [Peptococcia bacterium]|jgi:penicillin-binding protein 2